MEIFGDDWYLLASKEVVCIEALWLHHKSPSNDSQCHEWGPLESWLPKYTDGRNTSQLTKALQILFLCDELIVVLAL